MSNIEQKLPLKEKVIKKIERWPVIGKWVRKRIEDTRLESKANLWNRNANMNPVTGALFPVTIEDEVQEEQKEAGETKLQQKVRERHKKHEKREGKKGLKYVAIMGAGIVAVALCCGYGYISVFGTEISKGQIARNEAVNHPKYDTGFSKTVSSLENGVNALHDSFGSGIFDLKNSYSGRNDEDANSFNWYEVPAMKDAFLAMMRKDYNSLLKNDPSLDLKKYMDFVKNQQEGIDMLINYYKTLPHPSFANFQEEANYWNSLKAEIEGIIK